MRLLTYFISFILFITITSRSYAEDVLVIEKICNKYLFQVVIHNVSDFLDRQFTLYLQKEGKKKKIFYQTMPGVFVDAACIKNKDNEDLFVFREACTGSACFEDIYGVFNPETEQVLINPSVFKKDNIKVIEALIEVPFQSANDKDRSSYFCCTYEQYTNKKTETISESNVQLQKSSDFNVATAKSIAANQITQLQKTWF